MKVKKTHLKTWAIKGFWKYDIFEIDTGSEKWLQADPITKGLVCRTAEDEKILRILLENDCANYIKYNQRIK